MRAVGRDIPRVKVDGFRTRFQALPVAVGACMPADGTIQFVECDFLLLFYIYAPFLRFIIIIIIIIGWRVLDRT